MDELSGHVLEAMDEELQAIKSAFFQATGTRLGQVTRCQTGTPSGRESCLKILRLRDRLLVQYGDQIKDKSTLAKMVGTNQAYSMARTPVIETADVRPMSPSHCSCDHSGSSTEPQASGGCGRHRLGPLCKMWYCITKVVLHFVGPSLRC